MELAITPEGVEIANSYLLYGNISAVCKELQISQEKAIEWLNKREVKKYIDAMYLDSGYRNRNNIANLLDEMIAQKLEEARESQIYTKKDLADLLKLAHQMRMDEVKAQKDNAPIIKQQNNLQFNEGLPYGAGNYGKLMEALIKGEQ